MEAFPPELHSQKNIYPQDSAKARTSLEIKKQKLDKRSGRSSERDKRGAERPPFRSSEEKLESNAFHERL